MQSRQPFVMRILDPGSLDQAIGAPGAAVVVLDPGAATSLSAQASPRGRGCPARGRPRGRVHRAGAGAGRRARAARLAALGEPCSEPRRPRWPGPALVAAPVRPAGVDSRCAMPETSNDCLFCRIAAREIPADIVHESRPGGRPSATCDPQAPTHILLIPKEHIESAADLEREARRPARRAVPGRRPPGQGRGDRRSGWRW